jgi:YVTN family beta-propeller protein
VAAGILLLAQPASAVAAPPLSPTAIVAAADQTTVYVACATSNVLLFLEPSGTIRQQLKLPASPSGIALSADGSLLVVTCAAPESVVCLVDPARAVILARLPAGHTALAPVLSPDGTTLYVCHRFNDEVGVFDLKTRRLVQRIAVEREPVAATLSADGGRLFVANHLHATTADAPVVAAGVSVIDTATRRVAQTLRLPNGSGLLLGMATSPDGKTVAVTHDLARFYVPTTQLERGWMNTAGLTLIDATRVQIINTVLLDNVDRGAATPWAVGWTADGARLLVTHAGTHELSVIDYPGLMARLEQLPDTLPPGRTPDFARATNVKSDVPNDLAFLVGLRRRIALGGNGPRSLALVRGQAWVPGYFSDSIDVVNPEAAGGTVRSVALGPVMPPTVVRRGEMAFNDATFCFQNWQSCATCHSFDARVDGLNWDLLNDGIGSPKNVKSLLLAHRTPPAMSLGVRRNAEAAVRAGFRHIQFATPDPAIADAVDEYLRSLTPTPSPRLEKGRLSAAARRGEKLYRDRKVGCARCHPDDRFTDLQSYDVGTGNAQERPGTVFDTPTLVELWRTAPYLHDGSALTLREVLTTRNRGDKHGVTSQLTTAQIDDLVAYVLSL